MGLATVTILFCDLVGSTALNVRLGDDAGAALGPVDATLALLASCLDRPDDARRHFATAIEVSERVGSPPFVARSALEWAEHGGRVDLAHRALDIAKKLGMASIEARAGALVI